MALPGTGDRMRTIPGFSLGSDSPPPRRVVSQICLLVAAAIIPAAVADYLTGLGLPFVVLAFQQACVGAAFVCNRYGRTLLATLILCYSALVCATVFIAISTQGFHDTASMMYPMMIVIGALLLSRTGHIVFSGAVAASIVLLSALQLMGLSAANPGVGDVAFVDVAVITAITGLVSARLVDEARRNLQRSTDYGVVLQALVACNMEPREDFFSTVAAELARLVPARTVMIAAFADDQHDIVRTLALVRTGELQPGLEFATAGTAFSIRDGHDPAMPWTVHDIRGLLPPEMAAETVQSCHCAMLNSPNGRPLGIIAVLDEHLRVLDGLGETTLSMFAASTAATLALQRETAALRKSEARLRGLVESDVVGIVSGNENGIMEASDYFLGMLGYSQEDLQKGCLPWSAVTLPEYQAACQSAFESLRTAGTCQAFEKRYSRRGGGSVPVLIGGVATSREPLEFLGFVVDLTRQKDFEQQLLQAQKLESVGLLAGGISHDFNNLLTVISGYSGMLADKLEREGRARSLALRIHEAAASGTNLTRQLLAFSRMNTTCTVCVPVNQVVEQSRELFVRLLGESFRLETILEAAPDCIHGDTTQLQQCLMNLLLNARDASPEGGTITIRTRNTFQENSPVTGGGRGMVQLSVQDHGSGMDATVQKRIFEPFFTTKEPGKGTGLGLSTVYGIVRHWGGELRVESSKGNGALFTISIPEADDIPAVAAPPAHPPEMTRPAPTGSATVLVVEDRDDVRAFTVDALEECGHRVISTGMPGEALEWIGSREDIDLLLTDIVMHGMRGTELARRAAQVRPSLRVLFMTGHASETTDGPARLNILMKPFVQEELAAKVRETLASPPAAQTAVTS